MQQHVAFPCFPGRGDGVAGQARFRPGQGTFLAQQLVEQAGFADIGPSHQGQAQRPVQIIDHHIFFGLVVFGEFFFFVCVFLIFVFRVARRGKSLQGGDNVFHPQIVFGGNRDRLAKAQAIGLGRRFYPAFAFVGGQDHRLARFAQRLGDDLVARRHAGAGIDQEQQCFGFPDRRHGLFGHAIGDAAGGGIFKARRIDQPQGQTFIVRIHRLAVAGHAWRVMYDRGGASGQPVKEA